MSERDADAPERATGPDDVELLLDVMLGKLVTYLRMCGYDATYALERGIEADDALADLAAAEGRTLISRDRGLVDRVDGAVLVTGRDVTTQLGELRAAGFELGLAARPTYCSACNGHLDPVDRTEPTPDYAPAADERDVWRCQTCGQHFWKGSHWDDVAATLANL